MNKEQLLEVMALYLQPLVEADADVEKIGIENGILTAYYVDEKGMQSELKLKS